MSTYIDILSPVATSTRKMQAVFPGWPSLEGLRVAVLDNSKPQFNVLAGRLAEILEAEHSTAPVMHITKGGPTMPATEEHYEALRAYDLVIVGSGDCGSCTSWSTHDAIELVRREVPSVLVVTEAFEGLARGAAEAFGFAELPLIVIPHPLGVKDDDAVRTVADDACADLVRLVLVAG